jgi:hypothetical protein
MPVSGKNGSTAGGDIHASAVYDIICHAAWNFSGSFCYIFPSWSGLDPYVRSLAQVLYLCKQKLMYSQ